MTIFLLVALILFGGDACAAFYFLARKRAYTITKDNAVSGLIVRGCFAVWALRLLLSQL